VGITETHIKNRDVLRDVVKGQYVRSWDLRGDVLSRKRKRVAFVVIFRLQLLRVWGSVAERPRKRTILKTCLALSRWVEPERKLGQALLIYTRLARRRLVLINVERTYEASSRICLLTFLPGSSLIRKRRYHLVLSSLTRWSWIR